MGMYMRATLFFGVVVDLHRVPRKIVEAMGADEDGRLDEESEALRELLAKHDVQLDSFGGLYGRSPDGERVTVLRTSGHWGSTVPTALKNLDAGDGDFRGALKALGLKYTRPRWQLIASLS